MSYMFKLVYGSCISTGDNLQALARVLSPVQMPEPYNNFHIAPACICTLCMMQNVRISVVNLSCRKYVILVGMYIIVINL